MNVVLVGRTHKKLIECEKEVKAANPKILTKCVIFDFSTAQTLKDYQNLESEISGLDVSIFVNNAGVLYLEQFANLSIKEIKDTIDTNLGKNI